MTPHPDARLPAIARRLYDASDFVSVARIVCDAGTQQFGLAQCTVMLHAPTGRPILVVDNLADIRDEDRLAYLDDLWLRDPYLRAVRELHVPVGDELTLVLPILDTAGLVGTIRCGQRQPFTADQRRDLAALATHVSVRLAHLGVGAAESSVLSRLTARQLEVARLTALGWTNAEIAQALSMSENTVKKHLKDVFARVEIDNRTELAALLGRVAPRDTIALGVTHLGGLAITKRAA